MSNFTIFTSKLRYAASCALVAALMAAAPGCGDDGENHSHDDHGPPHSLMRVGSTIDGAGMLAVAGPVPVAFVVEQACLGGSGDHCTGGTVVYAGTSPGFDDVRDTDPTPPFPLPEGVEVHIEIVAADPGASLLISGATLDAPGERVLVNPAGHLHNHPTWQAVAPGGESLVPKTMSFRLHADGFGSSEIFTITIEPFHGDDHSDDDHDDGRS